MIYPRQRSRWRSEHDTIQLQLSSRWQCRIRPQASSATILESNGQAAINWFLHINTRKVSCGDTINCYIGATTTSWASGALYCLGGGGSMQACAAGIQERVWLSVWMIRSARYCIYLLEQGFKQNWWAIGCMDSWKSGRYEHFVDDVTGLIVGAKYNSQTALYGIPAMVMTRLKPIAIKYVMVMHRFPTNTVKTAKIHRWWYEENPRSDPAQRNSDPPCAYLSVVNEWSQWLSSLLTLCIRLSKRLLAPVQQWYTAGIPQSTPFTDIEHSRLQRFRDWYSGHWWRTGLHEPQTFVR